MTASTSPGAAMLASVRTSDRLFWLLFTALSLAVLAPLLLSTPLPLGDYANHLARLHILSHLPDSEFLQRYYEIRWAVIPNLASDLLVPGLVRSGLLDVEQASVLFMALSLMLIASGAAVLGRVLFGRWSYLSLTVFLLLYNRHFLWGFMNYMFAIGLMLWVLAAWIHVREHRHWSARLLFFAPATALFTAHLFPLGVYGLCVMAFEWDPWSRTMTWRRRLVGTVLAGLQFLPALALLLFASPTAGRAGDVVPGSPLNKLLGLLDIFNNYSLPLDAATWVLAVGLLAIGIWCKALRIHPMMQLPLLILLAIYFLLPHALFSSAGADRRLTAAVWILLAASLGELTLSRRMHWGLVMGLVALFALRMGVISWNWHQANAVYARYIVGMDRIDRGARVAILVGGPAFPWLRNPPVHHLGMLMVVRKDAFTNGLFAEPGAQVVMPTINLDTDFYKSPSGDHRLRSAAEKLQAARELPLNRFDWIYLFHASDFAAGLTAPALELAWRDDDLDAALYRIRH